MTFHAACGRILRRGSALGFRSTFTIYDSADQLRLTKQCLEDLERDPKRFTPRGIHSQISNAKNQLIGPDDYASRVASFYDQTVADVYKLYQTKMFNSNAVDFDDMLYLTVDVLERFPEAQEKWQNAFRYVLVDEYQDTNHAQYRFLQLLAEKHMNVFAVGDPDQSIYAFRGADIRNVLEFERDFRARRRSRSSRTTARRTRSSKRRTASSRTTGSASRRISGRSSVTAIRSASSKWRTSIPRLATSPPRSRASSRRDTTATRSPSSTGRTRRAACSRTCSSARASRTR